MTALHDALTQTELKNLMDQFKKMLNGKKMTVNRLNSFLHTPAINKGLTSSQFDAFEAYAFNYITKRAQALKTIKEA
jgi:hypothetical protein